MIFRGMYWFFEDFAEGYIFLGAMLLMLGAFGINNTLEVFGGIYFLTSLILLTEIVYHIEPRTKEDKKNGRSYWMVFGKKLDSATDAVFLIVFSTWVYQAVTFITLEHVQKTLQVIGIIVASIVSVMLYLWMNRLRDRPKKKTKGRKKSK